MNRIQLNALVGLDIIGLEVTLDQLQDVKCVYVTRM